MTEPTEPVEGEFTILLFGDMHIDNSISIPNANIMMEYIRDNAGRLNTQAVLFVGDLTDGIGLDVTNATALKSAIENNIITIPHLLAVGNHDHNYPVGAARTTTDFNNIFGQSYYTSKTWWSGGFYEVGHSENSYLLLTIDAVDYIVINMEMFPRQAVIDWLNSILAVYHDRVAIILTHAYEFSDNTPYSYGDENGPDSAYIVAMIGTDIHSGDEVWDELIKLHDNIILVHSGHKSNTGRHVANSIGGNAINQMLFDYEYGFPQETLVRFIRINPTEGTIKVEQYSPVTGYYTPGSEGKFTMNFVPPGSPVNHTTHSGATNTFYSPMPTGNKRRFGGFVPSAPRAKSRKVPYA